MEKDKTDQSITRRDFIKKVAGASVAAGATLAVGGYFYNRHPVPPKKELLTVRSFGIKETFGRMGVAKGQDPHRLVREAVDLVGGIDQFIQKGDKVLVKVNCAFARPAWMGATTSPQVAAEVVSLCLQAGASAVRVTDFPISDPRSCFLRSGVGQAVTDAGGEIHMPRPADFRTVQVSEGVIGPWEVYYQPLAWADKVIGVPTVKTHNLCATSLAMKNWYGFIGGQRSRFHQDIHTVIAELGQFICPTLIVMDATRLLVRNGPTGGSASDVVPGLTVIATTDQVAADALGTEMLEFDPRDVRYIQLADQWGLGKSDYRSLAVYKEVSI